MKSAESVAEDLISICIPTFKRPKLLALALESCARQDYRSLEIVIGDDSPDNSSTSVVDEYRDRRNWDFSYRRNEPALGQNANVAALFARARGRRLILLHDDDTLLPEAVSRLAEPWECHPQLAMTFGKQQLISAEGSVDDVATEKHNATLHRGSKSRLLENAMQAALLLQIPNDGYLVDSALAHAISYRSEVEVGVYCDKDFSLRLGATLAPHRLYYVDWFVSQYRATDDSISNAPRSRRLEHPRAAVVLYEFVRELPAAAGLDREKEYIYDHWIDKLVKGYAISGKRTTAARLFLSNTYGWRRRLSPRGFYHLLLIVEPRIDRLRRYE